MRRCLKLHLAHGTLGLPSCRSLSASLIHSEPLDTDTRAFANVLSMDKGSKKKKGRRTPQLENEQASTAHSIGIAVIVVEAEVP